MDIPSDVYDVFIKSCFEQLADIETYLLDLEQHACGAIDSVSLWDAIIRPAHSIKADAASIGLNGLVELAHAMESALLLWRERGQPLSRHAADVFLASFDRLRSLIKTGQTDPNPDVSADVVRLEQLGKACSSDAEVHQAEHETEMPVDQGRQSLDWMHVPAGKMDALVGQIGEMLVLHSRLASLAEQSGLIDLSLLAEQIEALGGVIRDQVMDMRLMPIGLVFSRFRRMVRDLASRLGKDVRLETIGEDTELDKTMVEQLSPLLAHMIRNAVDHGIESPEKRLVAGKSEAGIIRLKAQQDGGEVVITVADDGAGVDVDALAKKALALGYTLPDPNGPGKEPWVDLMFLPGVTQTIMATDVSGRGMGMDAVRETIHCMNGSLVVESHPGQGVVFTLRIPLSMTVFTGLEVRCAESRFLLYLESVVECIEETEVDMGCTGVFNYRGKPLPVLFLRRFFRLGGTSPQPYQIVVVDALTTQYAVIVDSIVGQRKAVFQKLSPALGRVDGVSGMSLTGDGDIALILDMVRIAKLVVGSTTMTHDK